MLSTQKYFNALNSHKPYSSDVDQLNMLLGAKSANLHISTMPRQLPADDVKLTFALVDSLTAQMNATKDTERAKALLLVRCAANTITQNYQDAISDADLYLSLDSTNINNKGIEAAVLCQRAVCNARLMNFEMDMKDSPSGGKESSYAANLRVAGILSDFSRAEALDATNANIFYSRGTFHAERREYDKALDYLSRAIAIDPLLPEAYYNRGIVYLKQGDKEKGITDLGKAGELGLYNAYSIIKANRSLK